MVYECLTEWGQIVCAICPNPKLVITGGTSTAICVWETGTSKERAKSLMLKQVKTPLPKKKKSPFRIFAKLINRDNSCSHSAFYFKSQTILFFTLASPVSYFFFNITIDFFCCLFSCIAGTTGSHRCCYMSDSIISVPHCCERLTGSNLHHLGPQQIIIRHPAQGASSTCLCSVHQ